MLSPFKISVVGLGVFMTVQATPTPTWNYSNTAWTAGTCASSYSAQSPIDIVVANLVEASAQNPPQQFNFVYEGTPEAVPEIEGRLVINDHTFELEWDVTNAAVDKYGMVVDDKLYRLRQFHYHSPSEHAVDGNHFDMEAHHVHFCEGVSCETPDNPDDEILVVSVFLRVGSANDYLQSFWNQYAAGPWDPGAGPAVASLANPYTSFMPTDKSYYSYVGSTTTPPCAENVQWMLLEHSVEMSQEQLAAYHEKVNALNQPAVPAVQPQGVSDGWVASTKTNNRPVQQLGDRTVLHFASPQEVTDAAAGVQPDTTSGFVAPLLVGLAALALLTAAICFCLSANKSQPKKGTRAVKPKPPPPAPKEAPKEETVPLMPPPLLAAPNLSMVVPAQPLMQAVPQAYTTAARPVAMAPYGQAPVVLQP